MLFVVVLKHIDHFPVLFGQIGKLIRRSGSNATRITVPALVLYTPNDVLTSREGVEAFFDRLASAEKLKVFFPGSYHLILHDKDRAAALQAIATWLDRAPAAAPTVRAV